MNKWDMFFGGLFYALPLWLMLIPIVIIHFDKGSISNDIFILAVTSMVATLSIGMSLMRIEYLEEEVEKLKKKKLNEDE